MNRPRRLSLRATRHSAIRVFVGLVLLGIPGTVAFPGAVAASSTAVATVPDGLTAGDWRAMRAAVERDQYRLQPRGEEYYAPNHAQDLHVTFGPEDFEVRPRRAEAQWRWGLRLRSYGYGDRVLSVSGAERVVIDNRIEYRRGDLVEWYVNDRRGLEQGFTLNRRPAGPRDGAPLHLHLSATGELRPGLTGDGRGITWRDAGERTVLSYTGLHAYDATGRALAARMEVESGGVSLRVEDQEAVYPITIDPFIEQQKLTAGAGAHQDGFGFSVAMSGNTAIIGAPDTEVIGAAYIVARNDGGDWEVVKKLVASDREFFDRFGFSVAISGDTVIVGNPEDTDLGWCAGSAYIFARNHGGPGTWSQVRKFLPAHGTSGGDCLYFGWSVAISGDTAIVGTGGGGDVSGEARGSAYIYQRDHQGVDQWGMVHRLFGVHGYSGFGFSLAISGGTAIVGAHREFNSFFGYAGAAHIFERDRGGVNTWGEVATLYGSWVHNGSMFGYDVAIDGETAVVGVVAWVGPAFEKYGAAFIFDRNQGGANNWGEVTRVADNVGGGVGFGHRLAISGNTVIAGARGESGNGIGSGAAYIFARDQGGQWGQSQKLLASDGQASDQFGLAVAIDGGTAIVGALTPFSLGRGSAYVFGVPATAPVANAGPDQTVNEGTPVTLDGSGSQGAGPLSYAWTQVAGPEVGLDLTDPARPTFLAPAVAAGGTVLTFALLVQAGAATSAPDTVDVVVGNVNHPPVAYAGYVGEPQAVREGSPVTLDGTGSYDADGETLGYFWEQTGGPDVSLSDPTAAQPTFTAPLVGTLGTLLSFRLTVSDGMDSAVATIDVAVENENHPPAANAGVDQTRDEGSLVTLDGTASADPDGDALAYTWTQVGGPPVGLSDARAAQPTFTAPQVGAGGVAMTFQLLVEDGLGGSAADEMTVTVRDVNDPPSCALARANPELLWPPNHKLMSVGIEGVMDPNDGVIVIAVTGVTQDEPVNGLGEWDTSPDAIPQGNSALIRAERTDAGNGRVYRIAFTAEDGQGGSCTGAVSVGVSSNRKPGNTPIDDGQLYDATEP